MSFRATIFGVLLKADSGHLYIGCLYVVKAAKSADQLRRYLDAR
jgi:hypothetical protein